MKHSDIRQAVIDALEGAIGHDAIYFDGRPVTFEEKMNFRQWLFF